MVVRLALVLCLWGQLAHADPVNRVLGDTAPETAGEVERIRAHLGRVAERLAHATGLSPAVAARREAALAALAGYIARGAFPQRTGDPYPGRRPEFIDATGVHCAVGYVIAASGQPELARALDAADRYAFIPEMRSAALVEWAAANGFTLDELAMIQPTYRGSPTEGGTRRQIEDAGDGLTLACAARAPAVAIVALHVTGDKHGRATATTPSTDPFARCIAEAASKIEPGGGAYRHQPEPYAFDVELHLATPQALFERRVDAIQIGNRCTPRPGAIPSRVDVTLANDGEGLAIHANTRPANAEVERCVEQTFAELLRPFTSIASLAARKTEALHPRIDSRDLERNVTAFGRTYVTTCAATGKVTITASAHRDDAGFTIAVEGAGDEAPACIRDKLGSALQYTYTTTRPMPDGTTQHYFRIDADVSATAHL